MTYLLLQPALAAKSTFRFTIGILLLLANALATPPLGLAQDGTSDDTIVATAWRYTLRKPDAGWQKPEYDDAAWKEGFGGFGTQMTPGARVSTTWRTKDIWLRRTVDLKTLPENPALYMYHDEDAEVFINGRPVLAVKGYITEYKVFPLDASQRETLRKGQNLLAVHCRQTGGGQFIDVHIVDANHIPKLPEPQRDTTPFQSELITEWGADVTPDNAWTEYPRPALVRQEWQNLNGHWDYAITPIKQSDAPTVWQGKVLVPFAIESKLSGVQRLLDASEALWYRRTFSASPKGDQRLMLNFEAVDYRCRAFVNGKQVGEHTGGFAPFSFDITDAVRDGDNELIVRVEDETEGSQLRGKQVLEARGIWYTQVSGIWQTVWLETVAPRHIEDLTIRTELEDSNQSARIRLQVELAGVPNDAERILFYIKDGDSTIALTTTAGSTEAELVMKSPKLWSPSSPHLYPLTVAVLDGSGKVVDEVSSYIGIRTVGKTRDENGHLRFTLNGETIFPLGPLDQGWWPDGLLTPPSDEAMLYDIQQLKDAGFNMIRKHIKVEPRRYYYHCDRLGMMLWQDQVSGGQNPPWTRLKPNPQDADWSDADHDQYMVELERMIDSLESHPSIVVWVPFNEAWGQHRTVEVGKWCSRRDPSRLINIASGGNFWPVGDIVDHHQYPHPGFPFDGDRYKEFIKVVGEFGGHGYPVKGHLWDSERENWGYGNLPKSEAEYKERYIESMRLMGELKAQGIAGGVYTQTTDVEGEINGLMTYDRKVIKIPIAELQQIHKPLTD